MEEQRSARNASAFEEKAELLKRETAEEILAQPKPVSGASISGVEKGKKSRSTAASGGKSKKKSSNSAKNERSADSRAAKVKDNEDIKEKSSPKKAAKNSSKASADEKTVKPRGKKSVAEKLASELDIELPAEKPSVKKRTPKKNVQPEEESVPEQKEDRQSDEGIRTSCKTPQVMKLIEDDSDELVIYAGKSRVPRLLRGRESLSRLTRRNAAENETEVVNITELVIKHEAADILDRFNACSCEECVEIFSEIIAKKIPVRYARISRSELEMSSLPERAVPMRKTVHSEMIRELICNKKRSFHNK